MERHVTGSDVVTAGVEALRHDMYHQYPGAVIAYYPATETADVQVMTNDVRTDVDSGARISEPWDLKGVPVAWLRFAGFIIKGTLAVHDPVILQAFDLDPTSAFNAGRTLKPVDPADVRRHGGGYWFVLPYNLLVGHAQGAVTGTLTIGAEGAAPCIVISGSTIQLGASGGDFVALASLVKTELGKIATAITALAGATYTPGPGSPAPLTFAGGSAPSYSASSVASALVAAQ